MIFNELTEDNFLLFAIKNYQNPQGVTRDDFERDLNHFKYVKRLLKKYDKSGVLRLPLIINHLIILYNVFGEATTPMLFFKVDSELWPVLKTIVVFLNKLPDYPRGHVHEIKSDEYCLKELEKLTNAKD
jgi:hypothetical protein